MPFLWQKSVRERQRERLCAPHVAQPQDVAIRAWAVAEAEPADATAAAALWVSQRDSSYFMWCLVFWLPYLCVRVCASVCECAVMLTTTPGRMPAAKGNYWADQAMHFAQPTDRSRPDALFALPDPSWRTTTWRTSGQASVRGCYVTLRYLVDFVQ